MYKKIVISFSVLFVVLSLTQCQSKATHIAKLKNGKLILHSKTATKIFGIGPSVSPVHCAKEADEILQSEGGLKTVRGWGGNIIPAGLTTVESCGIGASTGTLR